MCAHWACGVSGMVCMCDGVVCGTLDVRTGFVEDHRPPTTTNDHQPAPPAAAPADVVVKDTGAFTLPDGSPGGWDRSSSARLRRRKANRFPQLSSSTAPLERMPTMTR